MRWLPLFMVAVVLLFACTSRDRRGDGGTGMDAATCGGCSLPPMCGTSPSPCSCGCTDGQRFGSLICMGGCLAPEGDGAAPSDASVCSECAPPPVCGNPADPCSCSCMPGQRFGDYICGDGCLIPATPTDAGQPIDGAVTWTSCEAAHGHAVNGDSCSFSDSCGNCCCEGSWSCVDGRISLALCECPCVLPDGGG